MAVDFDAWESVYKAARDYCAFADAIEFLRASPGTVNNRFYSGCTLLHQAAYWCVDNGIYEGLKECGADPTIRDTKGRLPHELQLEDGNPEASAQAEAQIRQVFGEDDADARVHLLAKAKEADFTSVMVALRRKPHLVNAQSYRGWTVLHQAIYHGVSQRLVTALLDLKACPDLRNDEGKTPAELLTDMHPESRLQLPGREVVPLQVGAQVQVQLASRTLQGVLQSVEGGEATVRAQDGSTFPAAMWRITAVRALPGEGGEQAFDATCLSCSSPVAPHWRLSNSCTGEPHRFCGDCAALFLWSQYSSYRLPMRCACCQTVVEATQVPRNMPRVFISCWPPGTSSGTPMTTLTWEQFVASVEERARNEDTQESIRWKLSFLAASPRTDEAIMYCDPPARGYKYRGCPRCGVIIEYLSNCKHMQCSRCSLEFCFLCLRDESQHVLGTPHDWRIGIACPLAPIQTTIASL